jgi:hypothetical protein
MAGSPQNPPLHAGHVVRRVLLHRNIAIDPETGPARRRRHSWPHLTHSFLQECSVGVTVVSPTPDDPDGLTQGHR